MAFKSQVAKHADVFHMNALPAAVPTQTDTLDGIGFIAINQAKSMGDLAGQDGPTTANQARRTTDLEEGPTSIHAALPPAMNLLRPSNPTISGKCHQTQRLHRLSESAAHQEPRCPGTEVMQSPVACAGRQSG